MSYLQTRRTTASDFNFIYELHRQVFYSYVEQTWGWKEEVQFNEMRADFDNSLFEIICYQGEDIGTISVVNRENELFITYLAILPAYQRRGFGSQLVGNILERAAERGIPVKLNVIRVNPAKAFYERLGFKVTGGDKALFLMERCSN